MQHAKAALVAGRSSLDELSYRRNGLFIALELIVLMLGVGIEDPVVRVGMWPKFSTAAARVLKWNGS